MARRNWVLSVLAATGGAIALPAVLGLWSRPVEPEKIVEEPVASEEDGAGDIGPKSLEYVADLASDSFKRQVDLDEAVWRSLPFFAAAFAFVATLIGHAAAGVPHPTCSWYSGAANLLLLFSVLSFAWALRWFGTVLRPREYEYPADDAAIFEYAKGVASYHAALGLEAAEHDDKVVSEMHLFMIRQYASAARTNFNHNGERVKARSRVLLFMLIGFVLA